MPNSSVRVLLVDDDEEDAFITEDLLREAPGTFELTWISSYAEALRLAPEGRFDVFLVDYRIGGETGIEFLERAVAAGVECPMILLTGVGQHEIDVAASEVGAADFLDKSTLTSVLLERAIRYAIAHAHALRDLAEQQRILATTLESLQGGIIAFDVNGGLLAANQRFRELMGKLSLETVKGQDFDPYDNAREILASLSDKVEHQIIELDARDGSAFEFRISPVPGGGNVMLGVDVTAQKTLQRKILEAKVAAETANRTKSSFLAKISHELRTPLNGVFGMAQLLKLSELDDKQSKHVEGLLRSAMGLMALIEDLLDISIIEQGRFKIQEEPINLHAIVAEASDIASAASGEVNLNITTYVDVPVGTTFMGDGKRIQQILTNFLSNATKHTSHGEIEILVRETADSWIRMMVRDDGPGVSLKDQARIFERFTQGDPDKSRTSCGVGLGLSIAKEMVEQMNGRIGVVSAPGSGAEFWFELPMRRIADTLQSALNA